MRPEDFNLGDATVTELEGGRVESIKNEAYERAEIRYRVDKLPAPNGELTMVNGDSYAVTSEFLALEAVRRLYPRRRLYGMPLDSVSIEQRLNEHSFIVVASFQAISSTSPSIMKSDKNDGNGPSTNVTDDKGEVTIEVSSETVHVTQALDTVAAFGSVPRNPGDLVNLDRSGNVNGVDITGNLIILTETYLIGRKKFNASYLRKLISLTKHVNTNAFRGFDPGEVLFDNFTATLQISSGKWRVTYRFLVRTNEEEYKIGDLTVPAKEGWDYVWFCFQPILKSHVDDEAQKSIFKKIQGGYISRLYPRTNFDSLRLPASQL